MIDQNELKKQLHYDKNTGIFTRLVSNHHSVKLGEIAGTANNRYIMIRVNGKKYAAHRLAWLYVYGDMPKMVDHINGNPSDNRIENLRLANHFTNNYNSKLRKDNTSGLKGINWNKKCKLWAVRVSVDGVRKFLGYFDNLEFAELVVKEARDKYHGEFARHQ